MQRHEILAWLGDNQGDLTDDQLDEFIALAEDIEERYPDADDRDEAEAALIAAHRLLVEGPDAVIAELAAARTAARAAEVAALAGLRQAAVQLVPSKRTEAGFGREAGVDRMTVRKWTGKSEQTYVYDWELVNGGPTDVGEVRARDDEHAVQLALAASNSRADDGGDDDLVVRRRGRNTGAGNWTQYDATVVRVY